MCVNICVNFENTTRHAQPFIGPQSLALCMSLKNLLGMYIACANNNGSGETANLYNPI